MEIELKKLEPSDYYIIKPYFEMRDPGICDTAIINKFLWSVYYDVKFFITEKALFWIYKMDDEYFTLLPMCKKDDLKESFDLLLKYFNEVLQSKLRIYIADEEGIEILNLNTKEFLIQESREYFDYIYLADDLRNLSGKKMHKKRNHYNAFIKQYEGRFVYEKVNCTCKRDIEKFLENWYKQKSDDMHNQLEQEKKGLSYILENCKEFDYKMAKVIVDGEVQAFTLGSYSKVADMVFVHIEKANSNIRGLYNFINREFIRNEYPTAKYVNREDDMGLEGLRKAKLSYQPYCLIKKYSILQK